MKKLTKSDIQKRAEKEIREDFESRLNKFIAEIDPESYENDNLSGWDFALEFSEWSTYQE
jgi:hypothetical protein